MSTLDSVPAYQIQFPAPQKVEYVSVPTDPVGPGMIRARAAMALMSTGTENIILNRLYDPGTAWDRITFPVNPGYSTVGVVEAVGEGVAGIQVGDRVAYPVGHRSHAVFPEGLFLKIPEGVKWEEAAWFSLAKIAFMGVLKVEPRIGDAVMVIGGGPIGQMALRWERVAGAETIVCVDPLARRLEMARLGGATATISSPIAEAREEVLAACAGKLPRVVIDSTGNAAVFSAALKLVADHGRLLMLGDGGKPSQQALTDDVLNRNITIMGAHAKFTTPEWNYATISRLFFNLVKDGRFSLEGLNTHVFKAKDCVEAYATANRDRGSTMGILFDWQE